MANLLLVEGMPGTGKSTNSRVIMSCIEQMGKSVRWIHEVARPHPTLFFNEANLTFEEYHNLINRFPEVKEILEMVKIEMHSTISIDLLELEWNYKSDISSEVLSELEKYNVWNFPLEKYRNAALEKWKFFVEKIRNEKEELLVILDSSIFQFQIYTFLLKDSSYTVLQEFIEKLFSIVEELNPKLIYFYRENVEDTISYLENTRGISFFEQIWKRDRHNPYYQNRPRGAEGYREFLRDYHAAAQNLFRITPFEKIGVEISKGDWNHYVSNMFSFLDIHETKIDKQIDFPIGIYENKELNTRIEIVEGYVFVPSGKKKRLIPRRESEFYIEDMPTILNFENPGRAIVKGEQLIDRWTTLQTEFVKVQ